MSFETLKKHPNEKLAHEQGTLFIRVCFSRVSGRAVIRGLSDRVILDLKLGSSTGYLPDQ